MSVILRSGRLRLLVGLLAALPVASQAQPAPPTFDFTADQFRKNLNEKIRDDTADKSRPDWSTVKTCRKVKETYLCDFNEAGFQSSITNMKKMDLVNGHFDLKLELVLETARAKVSRIALKGSRADFANLLQWVGTVVNVMQTFDAGVGKQEGALGTIGKELGLMRGDAADDIGQVKTSIEPYAEIDCLTLPSSVTLQVECQFIPRS